VLAARCRAPGPVSHSTPVPCLTDDVGPSSLVTPGVVSPHLHQVIGGVRIPVAINDPQLTILYLSECVRMLLNLLVTF
jgi:hypothetical protein